MRLNEGYVDLAQRLDMLPAQNDQGVANAQMANQPMAGNGAQAGAPNMNGRPQVSSRSNNADGRDLNAEKRALGRDGGL